VRDRCLAPDLDALVLDRCVDDDHVTAARILDAASGVDAVGLYPDAMA
jgi:hypothetical protein